MPDGLQPIWILEEGSIFRERESLRQPFNNKEIQYRTDTAQWARTLAIVAADCNL